MTDQKARTDLDRELARWLAAALVKDYLQFPEPPHQALDTEETHRYLDLCPAENGGPARRSGASGPTGAGPQQALADQVGVARNTSAWLERGTRRPSVVMPPRLARALRINVADLFR